MCTDVSHDIHVTCMSVGRAVSKLVCVLICGLGRAACATAI